MKARQKTIRYTVVDCARIRRICKVCNVTPAEIAQMKAMNKLWRNTVIPEHDSYKILPFRIGKRRLKT